MKDDEIIEQVRERLFDRNTRDIAQGWTWRAFAALIRRIDELEAKVYDLTSESN